MSHPTELQLLLLADHALPADQAAELAAHADGCAACQQHLAALAAESALLASALQADADSLPAGVEVPPFKRPATLRGFALANIATGLVLWLGQFLWKTLFGELVVDGATWLTSIYLPDAYALASATTLALLNEGTTMLESYLLLVAVALAALAALWLGLLHRRHRQLGHLAVLALVGTALVTPTPADALEIRRHEQQVVISADEIIDDTLVVAAERVVIEGIVTGSVVAAGKEIRIDGAVGGNLVTFGESISISGNVGGSHIGAGESVALAGADVSGDLWLAGERVTIDSASSITGNAGLASDTALVSGPVGRDLMTATDRLELDAEVGGDLKAAGRTVRLLGQAHILGDARLHVRSEDRLERAAGARIDGELEFLAPSERLEPRSRYATGGFYLWLLISLASAVLVGVALLWLFPGLRSLTVAGGIDGLKTGAIGFATLVGVPVLAGLLALTLVGLPFALLAMAVWVALFYLAKVAVGIFIGRQLLDNGDKANNNLLLVLTGLALVTVAVNLPWVGGVFGVVVTLLGVGLLAQRLYRHFAQPAD